MSQLLQEVQLLAEGNISEKENGGESFRPALYLPDTIRLSTLTILQVSSPQLVWAFKISSFSKAT